MNEHPQNAESPIAVNFLHVEVLSKSTRKAGKTLFTIPNGQTLYIESLALNHYITLGCTGIHAENNYWLTLLQLYLWDILRYPVRHPEIDGWVGSYRADFYEPGFYQRHQRVIDARLKDMLRGWRPEHKLEKEFKRYHTPLHGEKDTWGEFTLQEYCLAVRHMPSDHICAIFRRLLEQPQYRKGLPDLFIIAPAGIAAFVEVKGKTERVSPEQSAWLSYIQHLAIPVEICRVIPETIKKSIK